MHAIVAENISKSFDDVVALKDLSIEVEEGELYGLIGPDGSGKTTLFNILTTLLLPEHGSASVAGWDIIKDFKTIRKNIGYMPGKFSLYQDLSVRENLEFFATIFGTTIQENYHLIKDIYVQLEPFKKRLAGNLSGGMKQKLALSCALIHRPKVLFLDEPTTGIDAVSRKELWEMLKKLKSEGITILVSTPYMDEAAMCDKIALMQNGEILGLSTPNEISNLFSGTLIAASSDNMYALLKALRENEFVTSSYAFGESIHVTLKQEEYSTEQLKNNLTEAGINDVTLEPIHPGIENVFMQLLTKKTTRDGISH